MTRTALLVLLLPLILRADGVAPPDLRVVFLWDSGLRWSASAPDGLLRDNSVRATTARKTLVRNLADGLGPGSAIRVGSFGDSFRLSTSWLTTRLEIDAALDDVEQRSDASPIWDALWQAVQELGSGPARRIVILVSDGRATGNVRGFVEVLHHSRAVGVLVHTVSVRPITRPTDPEDRTVDPAERLRILASETGGTFGNPREDAFPAYLGDLMKRLKVGE